MDLFGRVRHSNWSGEDIQSYEPEDTLMQLAVFCDELTFHEPHVRLKRQWIGEARASSRTANAIQSNEPLEVGDLRWFVEACQWSCCW